MRHILILLPSFLPSFIHSTHVRLAEAVERLDLVVWPVHEPAYRLFSVEIRPVRAHLYAPDHVTADGADRHCQTRQRDCSAGTEIPQQVSVVSLVGMMRERTKCGATL